MKMRQALIGFLILLLAACAQVPNPQVEAAREVCRTAYADPALDPIRAHIPLGSEVDAAKISMDLLANPAKPNNVEREALHRFDAANRRCWDAWDSAVRPSAATEHARARQSTALAELVTGEITFGQFNRQRAVALSQLRAEIEEAEARERAAWRARQAAPMFCHPHGYAPFHTLHCF